MVSMRLMYCFTVKMLRLFVIALADYSGG